MATMANPVFREARVEDLPEITRIRTSVRENHLSVEDLASRGITHETTSARMNSGELGSWVATLNGDIVAFAFADKTNGNLWALFTDPAHEGKGCGSALLSKCENWLKDQGLAVAVLDTAKNSKAAMFYAKRGWNEYRADEYEIFMRKQL
jgi:GNAT superfamily N-acetyltransferase